MALWDKRRERIATFVLGQLEAGESIQIVVPTSQTRRPPMLHFLTWPLATYYGLVLTDRRLLVVRCNPWSTPRALERSVRLADVRVERYAPGSVWGKLRFALAGERLELAVHRVVRHDTDLFNRTLGRALAAT